MKLIVLEGPAARPSFEIGGPTTLIGRAPECDVLVFDAQVSRRHAQLHCSDGVLVVESLQQTNPVIVNDRLVPGRQRLLDGAPLVLGAGRFEVDTPPPTRAAAPALGWESPPPVEERHTPRPPFVPPPP